MDISLSRPVQVTVPAVAGASASAFVVPAPITPVGGSQSPMPSLPIPSTSSADGGVTPSDDAAAPLVAGGDQSALPSRPVAEFLFHLTRMLTDPSIRSLIEWTPQGTIRVHDPVTLEAEVLGKYFRHSKYSSFQRQLNYFGFRKVGSKGRMSPCSYINDDTTDDLSSLLSIKRKTANRARSRKAKQERVVAAEVSSSSSSDCECSSSIDGSDTEQQQQQQWKKKKAKKDEKKRKKSKNSTDSAASKKKRRLSPSEVAPSFPSAATAEIKLEPGVVQSSSPILVTADEFGPPGTAEFGPVAPVVPQMLSGPMISPSPSSASVQSSVQPTVTQQQSSVAGSWEQLYLPQAALTAQPAAATNTATAMLESTFQQAAAEQQQQQPQPQTIDTAQPLEEERPAPFVPKFNVPNPLAHLDSLRTMPAAPATAAIVRSVTETTVTPDLSSGFPSVAVSDDGEEEEVSVEKLLAMGIPSSDALFPSSGAPTSHQRFSSFGDLGDLDIAVTGGNIFPTLSPNSSLVELAMLPTLAS